MAVIISLILGPPVLLVLWANVAYPGRACKYLHWRLSHSNASIQCRYLPESERERLWLEISRKEKVRMTCELSKAVTAQECGVTVSQEAEGPVIVHTVADGSLAQQAP